MRYLVAFVVIILSSGAVHGQLKITLPLKGVPGKDYFINNHVDHDLRPDSIRDAFGGTQTYDGHMGTDFSLKNFAAMDSGVYVYAVADGKVYEVQDGNYDRQKKWVKGTRANFVVIDVAGNCYIKYLHFMKNSILVHVGDSVKCGQPLGKVGSSGFSNGPHVHLEIRDKLNKVVDPFRAPGNNDTSVLFLWQPPYDTALYVIDAGFVPYAPGLDTLREGYLATDTFSIRNDTAVCFWQSVHGLHYGDDIKYIWITPKQRVWQLYNHKWTGKLWREYAWSWIHMPEKKGMWTVKYCINDKLVSERQFYVR